MASGRGTSLSEIGLDRRLGLEPTADRAHARDSRRFGHRIAVLLLRVNMLTEKRTHGLLSSALLDIAMIGAAGWALAVLHGLEAASTSCWGPSTRQQTPCCILLIR